jgi:signal transduction histidine kinase
MGSGLGLSITKKIISDHHGEISVKSEANRGSTFRIRIPLTSKS